MLAVGCVPGVDCLEGVVVDGGCVCWIVCVCRAFEDSTSWMDLVVERSWLSVYFPPVSIFVSTLVILLSL